MSSVEELAGPAAAPAADRAQVIVVGGGAAGVAAAVGAARAGARVILLERGPCLGGAATLRNVLTFCGLFTRDDRRQVVHGIAGAVLDGLRARGAVSEPQRFTATAVVFDPEQLKIVLDDLCAAAGVEVRLHSMVAGVRSDPGVVREVDVVDHGGIRTLAAAAFVDAGGEADLAHLAGAKVRYGTAGRVQNASLGVRFGGVPTDVHVDRSVIHEAVRRRRESGDGRLRQDSGLVTRLPVSGDLIAYLVDEEYDVRDALGTSRAEARARRAAEGYLEALRSIPGLGGTYVVSTGPELGTRESRHVVAPRLLTETEILRPSLPADTVAVGAWPVEYHPGPGRPSEWRFIGDPGFYGIPLDSLRSVSHRNLFAAGRTVDADRGAGASLRVMGTAFATGHAAGIAAAFTAAAGGVRVEDVRAELQRQDARLPRSGPGSGSESGSTR